MDTSALRQALANPQTTSQKLAQEISKLMASLTTIYRDTLGAEYWDTKLGVDEYAELLTAATQVMLEQCPDVRAALQARATLPKILQAHLEPDDPGARLGEFVRTTAQENAALASSVAHASERNALPLPVGQALWAPLNQVRANFDENSLPSSLDQVLQLPYGEGHSSVLNELQARITTAQELVTPQRLTAIMQELLQSVAVRNVIADVVDAQAAQHHITLTPTSRQRAVQVVLARNPALGQASTAPTQALEALSDDIATISYAMTVLPNVWEKQREQAAEEIAKATGLPKTGVLRFFLQSSIGEEALFKAYLADTRAQGQLPPQPDIDEAAQWRSAQFSAFVNNLANTLKSIQEADLPGSGKSLLRTRLLEGKVTNTQVAAYLNFAKTVAANISTEQLRTAARGFKNGQQDATALVKILADVSDQVEQHLPAYLDGTALNDDDKALLRHMGRQALMVSLVRNGGFNSLATLSAEQRDELHQATGNEPKYYEALNMVRACRGQLARRILPYSVASAILEGAPEKGAPEEDDRLDQFLEYGMPLLRQYAPGLPPEARTLLWRIVGNCDFREDHHAAIALLVPQLAKALSHWNAYSAAIQQAFQNVRRMVPQFQAQSLRDLDVPILSRLTRRLLQSWGDLTPETFGAVLHDVLINAHVPAMSTSLADILMMRPLNTIPQPFHDAAAATLRDLRNDFPEQLGQVASLYDVNEDIRRSLADRLRTRGGVATPRLFSDMLRQAFLAVQRQAALVNALKAQWQPAAEVDRKPDSF